MLFVVFAVVVDLVGVFAVDVLFTFLDTVLEVPKALAKVSSSTQLGSALSPGCV